MSWSICSGIFATDGRLVKVIIATSSTPFVHGGASLFVDWLEQALQDRGHDVEVYTIPVDASPERLPLQMLGLRLWDFTGHGDRLITVRTPAHLVRHHAKVAWFIHHHRPAYDLWETHRDVPDDSDGHEFRRMLFSADEVALAECRAVFTNSQTVSERLRTFNGIESEVLYPPLSQSALVPPGPRGDTIVSISRVVSHKRQLLAVQAMAHTRSGVRLHVAGLDSTGGQYAAEITRTIDRLGLQERVTFEHAAISDQRKNELLSTALAVVHAPVDEDSYGYVGLEAASALRAIVTTTDAGGVLEHVDDGENGLVVAPEPEAVAAAFDRLYEDRESAARLGENQATRTAALGIDWDLTIARLLA
jgi:glycosyltransferase involved in cell wall biosynthesis